MIIKTVADTFYLLTLCDNTERSETITMGTNKLIGTDPCKLPPALARLMAGQWKQGAIPPKWDARRQSGSSSTWSESWHESDSGPPKLEYRRNRGG